MRRAPTTSGQPNGRGSATAAGPLARTLRFLRTVRHLRPGQIVGRLAAAGKRSLPSRPLPPAPPALSGRLRTVVPPLRHEPWNRRDDLRRGRFRFLNRTRELGRPVDWTAAGAPLLWRFHLHGFGWLHLLEPAERDELRREWIEANPRSSGGADAAWHPYPTSLRIVSWCRAGSRDPAVLESLYRQAAHLARNLEFHPGGNHLLENARALVFAGCFFGEQGEAPDWLARGIELWREQLDEQVLADGGHYERSPMYHALVLEACVDVLSVLRAASDGTDGAGNSARSAPNLGALREELAGTVPRMADFLVSLTGPDGRLPLFNDSTHEIAPPPTELLRYAERVAGHRPEPRASFPETGYHVHAAGRFHLVIDAGPVGPDHLPAHAHADVFSYTLGVEGLPFVVDSGVYEYAEGTMRDHVRSTRAHNTVEVDGTDQAECWSSFRVARRYAPEEVAFSIREGRGEFSGVFGGYRELVGHGITHRRTIVSESVAGVIHLHDRVNGRGVHRVTSRVHLHPGVAVERTAGGVRLEREGVVLHVETPVPFSREEGWYCPEFGRRLRCPVLLLGGEATLPTSLEYRIRLS